MCVDSKANTVSKIGTSGKHFRLMGPPMVTTCMHTGHWLNEEQIAIGSMKGGKRARPVVVVGDGAKAISGGDRCVTGNLLRHNVCSYSYPHFRLELLENDERVIGVVAEPHGEERTWCNPWDPEGTLVDSVEIAEVDRKLLLEVSSWHNGVKLNREDTKWIFPQERHKLFGLVLIRPPMGIEVQELKECMETLRRRLHLWIKLNSQTWRRLFLHSEGQGGRNSIFRRGLVRGQVDTVRRVTKGHCLMEQVISGDTAKASTSGMSCTG